MHDGGLTAIRIEGPINSVDQRLNRLSKELGLLDQELSILDNEQSNIFWSRTKNLEVFKSLKTNLLRIVVPISETLQVIQKFKNYEIKYFIDWGGSLIWASFDQLNTKILKNDLVNEFGMSSTNKTIPLWLLIPKLFVASMITVWIVLVS